MSWDTLSAERVAQPISETAQRRTHCEWHGLRNSNVRLRRGRWRGQRDRKESWRYRRSGGQQRFCGGRVDVGRRQGDRDRHPQLHHPLAGERRPGRRQGLDGRIFWGRSVFLAATARLGFGRGDRQGDEARRWFGVGKPPRDVVPGELGLDEYLFGRADVLFLRQASRPASLLQQHRVQQTSAELQPQPQSSHGNRSVEDFTGSGPVTGSPVAATAYASSSPAPTNRRCNGSRRLARWEGIECREGGGRNNPCHCSPIRRAVTPNALRQIVTPH